MLAIVNQDIPRPALQRLEYFAEVVRFRANDFGFPFLEGHADLFFCQIDNQMIVAPNTPEQYIRMLEERHLPFLYGSNRVGANLLGSYNVAVGNRVAIGNRGQMDPILRSRLNDRTIVPVKQGFARCTTVPLPDGRFVTSDSGIAKKCASESIAALLVDASCILLPGYRNGCFGGCCGLEGNRLFLVGSLANHPQEKAIRQWIEQSGIELIELYAGPLFDVGSIFFVE